MQYNAEWAIDKFGNIAKTMGVNVDGLSSEAAAQVAIDGVKALARKEGIPEELRELNVKEEDLGGLAQPAFEDVCTPGNPCSVELKDILKLYENAF